jgi:hypothetical protein
MFTSIYYSLFTIYWVCVDICVKFSRVRLRALIGEACGTLDLFTHILLDGGKTFVRQDAFLLQACRKELDRVALLVLFDF